MGDLQVPGAMYEFYIPGLVNVNKKLLKMAIEIVSFPIYIKNMVIVHSYVSFPEGIYLYILLKPLKPT